MKWNLLCILAFIGVLNTCSTESGEFPSYLVGEKEIEYRDVKFEEKTPSGSLSRKEAQEDLEEFIYILETAYAGYEYRQEFNHVNWNRNIREARRALQRKGDQVSQNELGEIFLHMTRGGVDGHFFIRIPSPSNDILGHYRHENFYFTQLWVEKDKDTFKVAFSGYENVHPSDIYTGPKTYLFPAVKDSKELYRVGLLSSYHQTEMTVNINKRDIVIPVVLDELLMGESNQPFAFSNNQGVRYIILHTLKWDEQIKDQINRELESLNPDQKLVLDLRNNLGGSMDSLPQALASYLGISENNFYPAGWELISPYFLQIQENYFNNAMERHLGYNHQVAQDSMKRLLEMLENPRRYWIPYPKDGNINYVQSTTDNQIIILVNRYSASAVEILCSVMDPQQLCIIGENTAGMARFAGPVRYVLNNSRIMLDVPHLLYPNLPNLEDEGVGVFPDYWQTSDELGDALAYVLGQDPQSLSPEFSEHEEEQFFNGNFEWNWNDGFMGWYYTGEFGQMERKVLNQENANVPSGDSCLNISLQDPSWASLSQTLTVKPHSLYRISGQFRLEGEPGLRNGGFFFSLGWPRQETAVHTFPMEEWQEVDCYIDSGEEEEFLFKLNAGSEDQPFCGDFYADNIKLERVDAVPSGAELIKL